MRTSPPLQTPRHGYRAFGLRVECDRRLAFPPAVAEADGHDRPGRHPRGGLVLTQSVSGPVASPPEQMIHDVADFPGGPVLQAWSDDARLAIAYDGWQFLHDAETGCITYVETAATHQARFELIVASVVLPLGLLYFRPEVVGLHGSAVAVDDRAWIFIGESGAGKSTTAYELLRLGARLLADDMALVDMDSGQILAAAPSVRLWRASGAVAEAVEDGKLSSQSDKRWFRLPESLSADGPVELGGIVVLEPVVAQTAPSRDRSPGIQPITGRDALVALLRQTFDLTSPTRTWARSRLERVAQLANRELVVRYRFARSASGAPDHLDHLVQFIRNGAGK